MKRILSLILTMALLLGLSLPAASLAAPAPKTPSIRKLTATANSVSVSWKAVKGAQGYEIAWGRKGVSDLLDDKATTTGTGITVSGLSQGTAYVFRIRAYYKSGKKVKYTSWSSKKRITTATSSAPVPAVTGASYAAGAVTLTWSTDSRAAGYEISWAEKGLALWGSPVDVGFTGSAIVSNRIIIGATMAFRVRGYWWKGASLKYTSWSDTKYLTIPAAPAPSAAEPSCPVPSASEPGDVWGPWSDWTKTRQSVNANKQEEIRYHWWAAKCKSCGTHNPYWGGNVRCIHCRKTLPSGNVQHVNVYTSAQGTFTTLNGRGKGRVLDGLNYWFCEPQYRYRCRLN